MSDRGHGDPRRQSGGGWTIRSKAELAAQTQRVLSTCERRTGERLEKPALAKAVGVSVSSMYAYLNGTTLPPANVFDRLLDVLGAVGAERERLVAARDDLDIDGKLPAKPTGAPHELPPDVHGFTGRAEQLTALDQMLAAPDELPSAVVVSALSGTAGVGKTALAVHWAHRTRDRFPGGMLYVDLRGYDPDEPMTPEKGLETLLRGLGVAVRDIPPGQAERAARYRTSVADKRMLVVLDNAHSTDQVRDLLPGTASCFVVITSRDSLAGLVARHGARRIDLDLLPLPDAIALLRRLVGDRVDAEPAAADALAERCARLPLALRVVAELASARPTATLTELVAELERLRLTTFGLGGDHRTAPCAVFSWSYKHLPADAACVFRRLGLHPGPEFDAHVTAALAGTTVRAAQESLDMLLRAHLIQPAGKGRLGMHDLLREYAFGRAEADESDQDRRAAARRMLDYYLHTTDNADRHLTPHRLRIPLEPPMSEPAVQDFESYQHALGWCDTELANLVAAVRCAADHRLHVHAWQLTWCLWGLFYLRRPSADRISTHEIGLASARKLGDRAAEAHILNSLGAAYYDLRCFDDAVWCYQQALDIRRELDDRRGASAILNNLGLLHKEQRRYDEALECYRRCLIIRRELGDRLGHGTTLNNLGEAHMELGRYDDALDCCQQALELCRELGHREGEGVALHNLGEAYRRLERHDEAIVHGRHALALHRELGNRWETAATLADLGQALDDVGNEAAARECWTESLAIFEELDDRLADEVRSRLDQPARLDYGEPAGRAKLLATDP
ncbi:tetratricopeptide repeat protein [Lentzea sp. NPDC005914]|uniref:tetratricopeptide repeat protein n=1 Tax=Lentzea sp. NPDC005914 TaxID=3154572 RepID=UPI003401A290